MITELTTQRYAAFAAMVESLEGGRWLVLTHDNPDPDSISAAAALSRILRRRFKHPVTVAYGGIIGRAENREMVRVLGIRLSHIRHLNWRHYRHVALVDCQPGTGNNQFPDGEVPDLVFDHHPMRRATQKARFADIRTGYGATATLLTEYYLASGLELTRRSATALVYAIRSETQDFGREFAGPDKAAFDVLFPHADVRALARIQNPRLSPAYFGTLHEALENLEGVGTLVISHLGTVPQPDIVPEIADLLLRLQRRTWSLVTGVFQDRVYLSVRTTNPRADAGRLMRRLLGRRGKGGGHGRTAGGWIGVDRAPGGDPRALQTQLAARLAQLLKKNPEKISPLRLAKAPPPPQPAQP